MKEKPLMAFLMERGVRENYSFFLPIKSYGKVSGTALAQSDHFGSVRKVGCKVVGRSRLIIGTKSCPGFFSAA